jgi:hypothetical protein
MIPLEQVETVAIGVALNESSDWNQQGADLSLCHTA